MLESNMCNRTSDEIDYLIGELRKIQMSKVLYSKRKMNGSQTEISRHRNMNFIESHFRIK